MRGLAAALLAGLVGCTGEVEVWLEDPSEEDPEHELAVGSFELPLDVVEVRTADGWVALARGPNPYNLLDFSGEAAPVELAELRETPARLAHDELPVGPLDAVRLRLLPDSALELELDDADHPVTLAEGAGEALTVPLAVEVRGDRPASITLVLDVHAAISADVGGGFVFAPELSVE